MKCRNIFCKKQEPLLKHGCYEYADVSKCEDRLRYNRVAKPPGLWKAVQWVAEHDKYYGRGK